jgi:hypothetical protein
MGFKRPKTFTFNPSDELLNSMLRTSNGPSTHAIASTTLLCKFIEKTSNYDIETIIPNCPDMAGCPLQNITQVYLQELNRIESSLSAHVNTNRE